VIDDGQWRPLSAHGEGRGRGFLLMRATMDEVEVQQRDDGTTILMWLALGC
jgi:anti-sigma regulatory factor (Ser/Thr protein kinase)